MKLITVCLLILCLIVPVALAIKADDWNGVRFRNLDRSINSTECMNTLEGVGVGWFENVTAVTVLPWYGNILGVYLPGGTILLYGNCAEWVVQHELAHHWQYMKGDNWLTVFKHEGLFDYYEQYITSVIWMDGRWLKNSNQ